MDKTVWTDALQKALNERGNVYIPKGKYYIDDGVVMPSSGRIRAHKHAEICLLKGTRSLLMKNEGVRDGSYAALPVDDTCATDISVEGGVWSEENTERLGYGKSGCFDRENSMIGVSTCLLFSGVKNLYLKDMTFRHTAGFAMQIGRCENFFIDGIKFEECFADGIHVNGFVKNGWIRNIKGKTGDDLVALNMYDWADSTVNNGPLDTVLVEKLRAVSKHGHNALRIQPGRLPTESGEIDCFVKNLYIRDVKGVSTFKMYLQTPAYSDRPDGAKVGTMENVAFEKIDVRLDEPVDKQPNYLKGDPIAGHFAAFEMGSNVKRVYFDGIKLRLNKKKYPFSHFVTVGPKSQYLPEKGLELFDPYVICEVENLYWRKVSINGKRVKDINCYIREIRFENLYDSPFASGRGVMNGVFKWK
ncbi:MAG: hypothetical protein IJ317_05670 [Clostridia bacterium]|nr:hypothetical protein [Clostridia bacterium]